MEQAAAQEQTSPELGDSSAAAAAAAQAPPWAPHGSSYPGLAQGHTQLLPPFAILYSPALSPQCWKEQRVT